MLPAYATTSMQSQFSPTSMYNYCKLHTNANASILRRFLVAFFATALWSKWLDNYFALQYQLPIKNDYSKPYTYTGQLQQTRPLSIYKTLNNKTRFELALNSSVPPTIYSCGGDEFATFIKDILPEYKSDEKSLQNKRNNIESTEYDLFVTKYDGSPCGQDAASWLLKKFKGQYIWMSGESRHYPLNPPFGYDDPRHHVFGPNKGGVYDLPLYYLQVTWWNTFKHALPPGSMVDGNLRPKGDKTYFLVYGQGNCVGYRNEAFGMLSTIGMVHQSGKCGAPKLQIDSPNITRVESGVSIYNWRNNLKHFAKYRFCLVMEHSHPHEFPHYVSEKILMAFAAGCIPIYYGPQDVIFDIFNKKAFVYYDVNKPQLALDQVTEMEYNRALYNKMILEPIAAYGTETIEKYFSFADDTGNGSYKNRLKEKLNLPQLKI